MTDNILTGVDLGGTKISAVVMEASGRELARIRVASPRNDYAATLTAIADIVNEVERAAGLGPDTANRPFGIGTPGSTIPSSGLIQNANSLWLNGKPLWADLERVTDRRVIMANDANCLALSESFDGAAAGEQTVFAVILGTGVGGGLVIDGKLLNGPLGISGEWGHNPLPWPQKSEWPGPICWCGRYGCLETWLSGPGLSADHQRQTGDSLAADVIASATTRACVETMQRYRDRLSRAIAGVVNIIDPNVVVLGGGLSRISGLAEELPELILPHVFSDAPSIRIVRAMHGDDSGVRGAARLCA